MSEEPFTAHDVFDFLEGTWHGEGRGGFPTIDSFDYREELIFTERDESTLAYSQRTEKRMDGQSGFITSHWENGFIRVLESGDLELVNAQSGGRSEVLIGHIEKLGASIRLHFTSKAVTNDPKVISTARTFILEGDHLRYEMEMSTTQVEKRTRHLEITLQRRRKHTNE